MNVDHGKKGIVCIATEPWAAIPQRSQQLMAHMKGVEILYFSPPDTKQDYPHKKKVKSNVTAYILPQTIDSPSQLMFGLRMKRVAQFISRIMTQHHIRKPLLWVTHPNQEEITCYLNYSTLVYDCSQILEENYLNAQEYLFRKSDLIFTASKTLKQQLLQYHRNVSLLENGVNYSIIEQASIFAELDPFEKRFGFAGVIDRDLDLSPLVYMAKEKPLWQFMVIGPCPRGNPYLKSLKNMRNVKFYGAQAAHIVSEFLCSCHVLLEFRYVKRQVQDVESLRMLEYLATGRPIVRQVWEETMVQMESAVYLARSDEEFLQLAMEALSERPDMFDRSRKQYAKNSTWYQRAEQVETLLTTTGLL